MPNKNFNPDLAFSKKGMIDMRPYTIECVDTKRIYSFTVECIWKWTPGWLYKVQVDGGKPFKQALPWGLLSDAQIHGIIKLWEAEKKAKKKSRRRWKEYNGEAVFDASAGYHTLTHIVNRINNQANTLTISPPDEVTYRITTSEDIRFTIESTDNGLI